MWFCDRPRDIVTDHVILWPTRWFCDHVILWTTMWYCDRPCEFVIDHVILWPTMWICDRPREFVTDHVILSDCRKANFCPHLSKEGKRKKKKKEEDVPLVEFMYFVLRQVRVSVGDSGMCCCTCTTYIERQLTPLYLCYVFRAAISSLVCWFCPYLCHVARNFRKWTKLISSPICLFLLFYTQDKLVL